MALEKRLLLCASPQAAKKRLLNHEGTETQRKDLGFFSLLCASVPLLCDLLASRKDF